jgi:hypothetical protein
MQIGFDPGKLVQSLSIPIGHQVSLAPSCTRRMPYITALCLVQVDEPYTLYELFEPFRYLSSLVHVHLDLRQIDVPLSDMGYVSGSSPVQTLTVIGLSPVQTLTVIRGKGDGNTTIQTAMQMWPSINTLVIGSVYHIFHNFPHLGHLTTLFLWSASEETVCSNGDNL